SYSVRRCLPAAPVGLTAHTHTPVAVQRSRLVSTAIVTRSIRSSRPGAIATLCDGIAKIWPTRGAIWTIAGTDRSAAWRERELRRTARRELAVTTALPRGKRFDARDASGEFPRTTEPPDPCLH